MPEYCFRCEACDEKAELCCTVAKLGHGVTPSCPKCLVPMVRDYQAEHCQVPAGDWPIVTEDLTGEPIEVKNAAHYDELCSAHGCHPGEVSQETMYRQRHIGDRAAVEKRGRRERGEE